MAAHRRDEERLGAVGPDPPDHPLDDDRQVGDPPRPDRDGHLTARRQDDAAVAERGAGGGCDVVEPRMVAGDPNPMEAQFVTHERRPPSARRSRPASCTTTSIRPPLVLATAPRRRPRYGDGDDPNGAVTPIPRS
ncbi:MAG: hypothetical protein QM733_02925 [Ilumatobacteraceae bacterium]